MALSLWPSVVGSQMASPQSPAEFPRTHPSGSPGCRPRVGPGITCGPGVLKLGLGGLPQHSQSLLTWKPGPREVTPLVQGHSVMLRQGLWLCACLCLGDKERGSTLSCFWGPLGATSRSGLKAHPKYASGVFLGLLPRWVLVALMTVPCPLPRLWQRVLSPEEESSSFPSSCPPLPRPTDASLGLPQGLCTSQQCLQNMLVPHHLMGSRWSPFRSQLQAISSRGLTIRTRQLVQVLLIVHGL